MARAAALAEHTPRRWSYQNIVRIFVKTRLYTPRRCDVVIVKFCETPRRKSIACNELQWKCGPSAGVSRRE
jgi:hypothetical protein